MEPTRSRWRATMRNLWGTNGSSSSRYRFLNDTGMLEALGRSRRRRKGRLEPWYRRTAAPEPPASASFAERDLARRGRLASAILLGFMLVGLARLPFVLHDPSALLITGVALVALVGLAALNRFGRVNTVGALLLLMSYIILGISAMPGGSMNANSPLALDLLVVTELIAATVLPPISVLVVAALNSLMIVGLVFLAPHTDSFTALLADSSGGVGTLLARSVALQVLVAGVAFLWVRGALLALRRADRAEEIAILERREIERTHEIEEGVRQLQSSLVQLANGDYSVRVPPMRNTLLWQVGVSINNLIARLGRVSQGEADIIRWRDEARQLSEALYAWSRGEQAHWPTPSGSPLDEVTLAVRRVAPMLAPVGAVVSLPPLPPLPPLEPGAPNRPHASDRPFVAQSRPPSSTPPVNPVNPGARVTPAPSGISTPPMTPSPSHLSGPLGPFPYFGSQGQPIPPSTPPIGPGAPPPEQPSFAAPAPEEAAIAYPDLYPTQRALEPPSALLAPPNDPSYPELGYPQIGGAEATQQGRPNSRPIASPPEQDAAQQALPDWLTADPPSGALRPPLPGEE